MLRQLYSLNIGMDTGMCEDHHEASAVSQKYISGTRRLKNARRLRMAAPELFLDEGDEDHTLDLPGGSLERLHRVKAAAELKLANPALEQRLDHALKTGLFGVTGSTFREPMFRGTLHFVR